MAKFLDYHAKAPQMSPEVVQQFTQSIKAGEVDQFGVKGLNAFITERGEAYCLSEGPSVDAICKSHEAKGMELGPADVREVNSFV